MLIVLIILMIALIICLVLMRKIWELYRKASNESVKEHQELSHIIEIYDIWLRLCRDGLSISSYLETQGIRNVALCSMTDIGVRLYRDLTSGKTNVVCIIDSGDIVLPEIRNISIDEKCDEVIDMVIITDPFRYEPIKKKLTENGYINIESIDGILYAMLKAQAENEV